MQKTKKRLSANNFEEHKDVKKRDRKMRVSVSIMVEDIETNEKMVPRMQKACSKSAMFNSPKNSYMDIASPLKHVHQSHIGLDLSHLERNLERRRSSQPELQKRATRDSFSKQRGLSSLNNSQKLSQQKMASKPTLILKGTKCYQQNAKFYNFVNYISRSSLCLLHKRSWLRMQFIKLAIPVKQKNFPRGLNQELLKQDDTELMDLILNSDASSDSNYYESEDEDLDEEFMENEPSSNRVEGSKSVNKQPTQTFDSHRALMPERQSSSVGKSRSVLSVRKSVSGRISKSSLSAFQSQKLPKVEDKKKKKKCSCHSSTFNYVFENTVLVLIVLSSLVLILDNPLNDPNSIQSLIIKLVDTIFTFLFLLEALIKIFALGLFSTSLKNQQPYMFTGWNVLDLFVVVASLIDFAYSPSINFSGANSGANNSSLKSLKALRALRALRPLRVISRDEGLKLVVNALFSSLPSLFNVMILNALFILIFSILGISFFKGTFHSCSLSDTSFLTNLDLIDTKFDCLNLGGNWQNANSNFDDIVMASLTLFQLMTCEGWKDIANMGVDARSLDLQPKPNNQSYWVYYFIFFIFVGNMFIMNLFVGVVIVNFNRMKDKLCGYVNMSDQQRKWVEMQRYMIRLRLQKKRELPNEGIQKTFLKIISMDLFDNLVMMAVFLNTIFMAMRFFDMPETYDFVLEVANYTFAGIFNVECIFKLIGMRKLYFLQYWNLFDFIIVLITNVGIVIGIILVDSNLSTAATIIRAFRIIRVFRVIKSSNNMKVLIDTLIHILPSLVNVAILILLMLFIFAALGINLFATVMYQEEMNELNNFRSFGMALICLFRCATGEGWNLMMFELANQSGYNGVECIDNQSYESMQEVGILGCGTNLSYLYFVLFIISVQMIVMNLFVAVVIEGFCSSTKENTWPVTS